VRRGGKGRRSKGCTARDLLLEALKGGAAATAAADSAGMSTRAETATSAESDATGGGATAEAQAGREPRRLDQLPTHSAERRVSEDPDLAMLVVTGSALAGDSPRARLLREVIAGRGLSIVVFDECHCMLDQSMAGYSPEMARVGCVVEAIDAASAEMELGLPRAARYGFTATLPLSATAEVLARMRLGSGGREPLALRGSVDRDDLSFFRLPLHRRPKESLVTLGVRVLELVRAALPPPANQGRSMI
jgi:hypothetical protein